MAEQMDLNADRVSPQLKLLILTIYCLPFLAPEWGNTLTSYIQWTPAPKTQTKIQNYSNENLAALLKNQEKRKQAAHALEAVRSSLSSKPLRASVVSLPECEWPGAINPTDTGFGIRHTSWLTATLGQLLNPCLLACNLLGLL